MGLRRGGRQRGTRLIRRTMIAGTAALAAAVAALWLRAPPERLAARYVAADCGRVALIDPARGHRSAGAEALALAPEGNLILAAHDRSADPPTPGGLHAIAPSALFGVEEARVRTLHAGRPGAPPFRPHGLAISPDGARLATINRSQPGAATVEIGALDGGRWTPDRRIEGQDLCRANGLAFTGLAEDDLLITLDRAACDTALADLLPGAATGRLARFDGRRHEIVREGLSFPNGILPGRFIAETRARRILRPSGPPIALPGGPDNLSLAPDGRLVAALHPRPHLLWFYLEGWRRRAPTRLVAVDPETGAVEILFDDPDGKIFSGATGAIIAGDSLVAGSVRDDGLLVCGGTGE